MLRSRKWYTGLLTWQYSDRVIATSLCQQCHQDEMPKIGAGNCQYCRTFTLNVAFHERHVCSDRSQGAFPAWRSIDPV